MSSARILELETLVAKHRREYYVDHKSSVSDETYDAWIDELAELKSDSPQVTSVGASAPSAWKKSRHDIPMGSLEKVNTPGELTAWIAKIPTSRQFEEFLVTEKLDGISVAIEYANGAFVRAVSRGDGTEGDDISVNVVKMKGVPGRLPKKFTGQVRGEIVCTLSDLVKHFPGYANPRNTAGGISNRLDGVGCEHLTVMVYHLHHDGSDHLVKRSDQVEFLEKLGFKVPRWYVTAVAPGIKTPHDLWVQYQQSTRAELDYAIDGLVVEVNNLELLNSLGDTNGRPHGARAFKFAAVSRESVLRSIENETGGTGIVAPVAVFDEVNLLGTKVTRASLYNWKYIRELKLSIGAKILVARANDVIPRVVETLTFHGQVAEPPAICSACGAATGWDGAYLVCQNTSDCPAQTLGRLLRFFRSLNILEWGEAVLERLVESKLALHVTDLYKLTEKDLAGVERMGPKSARKLLENLHAKSPVDIDAFFGSLSIPGCGVSILTLVVDAGYDTVEKLSTVTYDQLIAISGLGPVRARALVDWFAAHLQEYSAIPLKERTKGHLTGKSFCFTGKTKNKRAVLEDKVRAAGGTVKSSAGQGLTFLVMSDPGSGSTKALAALKNGTKTISEDDFLAMV